MMLKIDGSWGSDSGSNEDFSITRDPGTIKELVYVTGVDITDGPNPTISWNAIPDPEPTTVLLLGSGMIGLAGFRRKFRKK